MKKKIGKYEKVPAAAPAKQPKVKNLLLQTYFTSLLCLVLCVTMFMGTSYAWFTSEVSNTTNEIYVGTLSVGLYKGDTNLANSDTKLFDKNIRWEPGYTALETIKVVNEGDLAFKYVLNFTDTADSGNLSSVADCFEVWVYDHYNKEYSTPASYEAMAAKDSGWVPVGTLTEVLAGKVVLDGQMVSVRKEGQAAADINTGTTDGLATPDTYTIALHMKEDADESVMGKKISLNVKLVAYQFASEAEKDSFGNNNYDSGITAVSDTKSLQSALTEGGNVQLITNVAIGSKDDRVTMDGGVLYGNGKTIFYSGGRDGESSVGVVTTSGGSVQNLTISGGADGRALYVTKLTSDLFVSDCVLNGAYSFNLNSDNKTGYTLNFTNTTFKSWTSYANVMDHAYFTDCKFEGVLKPYGDTTLTNCVFTTQGLDVSELQNDETVTLINCTYGDQLIEKAVLTAGSDGNIAITNSTVLALNTDKMVVLASNS